MKTKRKTVRKAICHLRAIRRLRDTDIFNDRSHWSTESALQMSTIARLVGSRIFRRSFSTSSKVGSSSDFDVTIVGGGIVGLATAREVLLRYPSLRVAVLEKEGVVGFHQTGHNSGVVHAGIYYKPGSLKAKLCVEGLSLSYKYFDERGIPYRKCGKLIVALNEQEIPGLEGLMERGQQNGVKDLRFIDAEEIRRIEPHCNGVRAILSPHTGIVDWGLVARNYAEDVSSNGGQILLNFEVVNVKALQNNAEEGLELVSKNGEAIRTAKSIFCVGAYSDRLARIAGGKLDPMIVPFRGEYLELQESKHNLVNGLIYPVPDPTVPFLGVHFTPTMGSVTTGQASQVLIGPNAVLAFAREGYRWQDVAVKDLWEALTFPGFWRVALKHWSFGMGEMFRSLVLSAQMREINKYLPGIKIEDVRRGRAGVRAQALDLAGNLVDDFVFEENCPASQLHVRNSPSPGATSSLAIAKLIVDKAESRFKLTSRSQ